MAQPTEYRQGVYVVMYDKTVDKVAIYRGIHEAQGSYKFPGGGIEKGETLEQAAIREIKEETGLSITIEQHSTIVDSFDWPESMQKQYGFRGQEKQFVLAYVDSTLPVTLGVDDAELIWVHPHELDEYFTYPEQPERTRKVLREFGIT